MQTGKQVGVSTVGWAEYRSAMSQIHIELVDTRRIGESNLGGLRRMTNGLTGTKFRIECIGTTRDLGNPRHRAHGKTIVVKTEVKGVTEERVVSLTHRARHKSRLSELVIGRGTGTVADLESLCSRRRSRSARLSMQDEEQKVQSES